MCRSIVVSAVCAILAGANATAGDDETVAARRSYVPSIDAADAASVTWIDPGQFVAQSMRRPINLTFENAPLDEVLTEIGQLVGMPISIDKEDLQRHRIAPSAPVSITARDEPAYIVLDRLCKCVQPFPLGWVVHGETLRVTSIFTIAHMLRTEVYPVDDLIALGFTQKALLSAIENETGGAWIHIDGIGGRLSANGDQFVCRQTDRVHREIAGLLAALRTAGRERRVMRRETHDHIASVLARPLTVDFQSTSLEVVLDSICRQCSPDLQIDERELRQAEVDLHAPVTIRTSAQPLRTALPAILDAIPRCRLSVRVENGQLQLSTDECMQDHGEMVVYDVSDLVGQSEDEMTNLIDLIQTQTSGPWFETHTYGWTLESPGMGILIVRQNQRTQEEVRDLIAKRRADLAKE
jgi:hypothetical protein